jgi:hypothetical protein
MPLMGPPSASPLPVPTTLPGSPVLTTIPSLQATGRNLSCHTATDHTAARRWVRHILSRWQTRLRARQPLAPSDVVSITWPEAPERSRLRPCPMASVSTDKQVVRAERKPWVAKPIPGKNAVGSMQRTARRRTKHGACQPLPSCSVDHTGRR